MVPLPPRPGFCYVYALAPYCTPHVQYVHPSDCSTRVRLVSIKVPLHQYLFRVLFCPLTVPAGVRQLLQTAADSVDTGPNSGLPDLTAVDAVAALCARNFTAVQYVTALDQRYTSGGFSCNNPWITYNVTKVQSLSSLEPGPVKQVIVPPYSECVCRLWKTPL